VAETKCMSATLNYHLLLANLTRQVIWLLPGFFLYSLAFGGIAVPKLNLVLTLVCREYLSDRAEQDPSFIFTPVILGGDNQQCRIAPIQALATKFNLYLSLVGGIVAAVSSPKLGAWSDRFGRKKLLCVTTFGGLLGEVVTILCAGYPDQIHYSWLLLGYFFDGITGSFIAGMALTHSYASDVTAPANRGVAFGYFHACLFGGIAIGPLIAAWFVEYTGQLLTVFYIALGCHTLFLIFLLTIIPESLSNERQLANREKHRLKVELHGESSIFDTLRVANFLEPLKVLYPTGQGSGIQVRMNLVLLSTVSAICFGIAMGAASVVIFYANFKFGWKDSQTQVFVGAANGCRVFALMVILPLLNWVFRTRVKARAFRKSGIKPAEKNSGCDNVDVYTIRIALAIEIVGFAGYALAKTGPLFFASGVLASFGGIAAPILSSALTKHVPHDRVGSLLGAIGLLHALARVVCPTIFSLLYAGTVDWLPQATFWLLSGCFVFVFVVSWFIRPHGMSSPISHSCPFACPPMPPCGPRYQK
jgi:MFS family permease